MPKVTWKEIDTLIHEIKGTLSVIAHAEQLCKKVRRESLKQIDELYKIISKQPERSTYEKRTKKGRR